MNRARVLALLEQIGAPEGNRAWMAEHALKRARQIAESRRISEEEALSQVLRLLREGWAGRAGETAGAIQPWPLLATREVHDYAIFRTRTERVRSPKTGREHEVHLLAAPDWVNVLAFTPAREIVLVQQYRHGSRQVMWEIPGGMIAPDEPPERAGERELLEETGYAGDPARWLAAVHPNPAFQTNHCHTVLVENARRIHPPSLDAMEDIAVKLFSEEAFSAMIADGRISNALVVAADLWRRLWREGRLVPRPPPLAS